MREGLPANADPNRQGGLHMNADNFWLEADIHINDYQH